MTRPGVEITSRAQAPPKSPPTDTGTAFMVGATAKGPDVALVRSLTEYEQTFGTRSTFAEAYDSAEAYWREGGVRLYVSRTNPGVGGVFAAGQSAEEDGADLSGLTRDELNAKATEAGIENPETLGTKQDVIDALQGGESVEPQVIGAGVQAALDKLTKDYGPGQVFIRDASASDPLTHAALLLHAKNTNRVALLHPADGTATALAAIGTALQSDPNARYGALFAPSVTIPGVTAGTTRTLPYPAIQAGIIARNDVQYTPNVASAGVNGRSQFALGLTTRYTDVEYQTLNEAGVDMVRAIYEQIETYGYRSLVSPTGVDAGWLNLGNVRLNMAITALAGAIAENYVFAMLDGRRRKISQFGGELRAMLVPYYEAGALYGETADEAFYVDVGQQVNTEATIAAGELHAVIELRMSPFAELVRIEIVKVATTQAIAA